MQMSLHRTAKFRALLARRQKRELLHILRLNVYKT